MLSQGSVLDIDLEDVTDGHEGDTFYGAVLKGMKGLEISDKMLERKIEKPLLFFSLHNNKLLYGLKLYFPRKSISSVVQLAHDSKTAGHFGSLKTLSMLRNYHWKHK